LYIICESSRSLAAVSHWIPPADSKAGSSESRSRNTNSLFLWEYDCHPESCHASVIGWSNLRIFLPFYLWLQHPDVFLLNLIRDELESLEVTVGSHCGRDLLALGDNILLLRQFLLPDSHIARLRAPRTATGTTWFGLSPESGDTSAFFVVADCRTQSQFVSSQSGLSIQRLIAIVLVSVVACIYNQIADVHRGITADHDILAART